MKTPFIIAGLTIGGLFSADAAGLRINTTASMPRGVWTLVTDNRTPRKGDVVTVCLPESRTTALARQRAYIGAGQCSNGLEPLLKPVVAVPGDRVTISAQSVTVNEQALSQSAPLKQDSAGRPIAAYAFGTYIVPAGVVWIISSYNPNSFDSRYFGPVPIASVQSRAKPLLVSR